MKRQCHIILMVFIAFGLICTGAPLLPLPHEVTVSADQSSETLPTISQQIIAAATRLLILPPHDMTAVYGSNASVQGPLTGKVFVTDEVTPEASDFLLPQLNHLLGQLDRVQVVHLKKDRNLTNVGLAPQSGHRRLRIAKIQAVGRENGANGVLCTYIYAFQERVGKDFGVQRPAKVALELNLVAVESGAVLWQAHFSETQQTLDKNLLKIGKFIKRGGRWITAREMATNAIEDLIEAFDRAYLSEPNRVETIPDQQ